MPLPPPPAVALISTGKPISWATLDRFVVVGDQPCAAGHDGHVGLAGHAAGGVLVAERPPSPRGVGPMNSILQLRQTSVKWAFSDKEAVARMNRLDVADFGRADDAGRSSGSSAAPCGGPMQIGFVGQFQILAAAIRRAIDADRLDAQLVAGADDPQGDFAAVGDENAFEHGFSDMTQGTDARQLTVDLSPLSFGHALAQALRIDLEQRLVELDRFAVLAQHGDDLAADLGRNLVEDLHRLDDADDRASYRRGRRP